MKLRVPAVLIVFLLAAPAFAQKVYIDYDRDFDTSTVKTFGWLDTPETSLKSKDQLMHSRLVNAVEHHLTMSGLVEDTEDPDIWVTYHASSEQNLRLDTSTYGYGYPSGWYRGGYYGHHGSYGSATTTVSSYTTGTLVVDAWSADSNQIIWRGIAENIAVTNNPTKMEKRIDKALKKIVAKSQKLRAKDTKQK